jgi:hypothetical protein
MTSRRLVKSVFGGALALLAMIAGAQQVNSADNSEWVENPAPPPPAFSKEKWVPIEMPPFVSLKVGVDPNTLTVGTDGVVRYVVVMVNASGSVNAVYEGLRCATDEVKTYARFSASGTWSPVREPVWRGVAENSPSRHSHAFARQGGCRDKFAFNKEEILKALSERKQGPFGSNIN